METEVGDGLSAKTYKIDQLYVSSLNTPGIKQDNNAESQKRVKMQFHKPYVTVIVTAFRRKEFLLEALSSLEQQTAGKDSFEVIVVKDFFDAQIDAKISEMGWKSVGSNSEPPGQFITDAITMSSGEVISFLDDDDVFEADKIARVIDVFSRSDHIGYYHNSASFINEKGESIKAPYAFNFSTSKEPSGERLIRKDEVRESVNRLIYLRHDFNKSSISVRKDILMAHIDASRQMQSGYDSFIFFCAALSDYSLLVDDRRLTRYRFNKKSVSVSSTFSFSRRQIKTFTLMHSMAVDAGAMQIARLLERQILFFKTINAIHDPTENRGTVLRSAISFIGHMNDYSRMGNTFASILSMTYMVSPKLSKRLYSKLTAPER